ncbi:hypothetical protein MIND_00110900 [Mycena indigotica]|uniref:Uncharacterized protein n=1 Tax=Mycena indigotica TaxID=2126181 RepID=A0A8H6TFX4_9AGAR|nr:uncharacterized protein MIND_00110900 [Mycena indigotica]KAF7315941.1 hypothetical protein MIND_00110900 [Mycena indigotica]
MFLTLFAVTLLAASQTLVNAAPALEIQTKFIVTPFDLIQMGARSDCTTTDECRNATQAAPFVNSALRKYRIVSTGERAALLSLIIFESVGFAFDINHSENNPGQGTRNQMNFPFILEYALDTPRVAKEAQALLGPYIDNPSAIPSATKNAIRELVLADDLSFASAMWFYTRRGPKQTGCLEIPGMVEGLQDESVSGWQNYLTQCIGTTVTEPRRRLWQQALTVLKPAIAST